MASARGKHSVARNGNMGLRYQKWRASLIPHQRWTRLGLSDAVGHERAVQCTTNCKFRSTSCTTTMPATRHRADFSRRRAPPAAQGSRPSPILSPRGIGDPVEAAGRPQRRMGVLCQKVRRLVRRLGHSRGWNRPMRCTKVAALLQALGLGRGGGGWSSISARDAPQACERQ